MTDTPKGAKTKKSEPSPNFCSFCGKSQQDVQKLIAGPGVNICDSCIDLCGTLLSDDPKCLTETRKYLGKTIPAEVDIKALGVKPRFTKLRFRLREKHVFYLCAFKEPFDTVYNDHVKPAVESSGFTVDRGDEIFGTQPIIEDIWEAINSAELILADVTGRNPNVMYEIGMAHTVGKPVVIISQDINDVPFDLKHYRCIVYSHTPRGCKTLEEKIRGTLGFLSK